jgi:hypothetical protein
LQLALNPPENRRCTTPAELQQEFPAAGLERQLQREENEDMRINAHRAVAGLLAGVTLAGAAQAADAAKRGGPLLNLDLDFGGDDIATVAFVGGGSQDVKAGQGISAGVGGWFRPVASSPFEIQGIVGYKYVTTAADNADIKVTRTTLALNGIYRFSNGWYLGAGVLGHMGPRLDGDGFFEDVKFDDATGFNAEVGWKWVALRVAKLTYSADGIDDVDAGSIGVRLTWRPGAGN